MASIRKEILIDAPPQHVWDAIRDFGAVHERLVPGFVVDARLDGDERIVTFFSGAVQREPLVDLDDQARRLVYATVDSPIGATHYNASVQVFPDGETQSRVEWIVDVLPSRIGRTLDGVGCQKPGPTCKSAIFGAGTGLRIPQGSEEADSRRRDSAPSRFEPSDGFTYPTGHRRSLVRAVDEPQEARFSRDFAEVQSTPSVRTTESSSRWCFRPLPRGAFVSYGFSEEFRPSRTPCSTLKSSWQRRAQPASGNSLICNSGRDTRPHSGTVGFTTSTVQEIGQIHAPDRVYEPYAIDASSGNNDPPWAAERDWAPRRRQRRNDVRAIELVIDWDGNRCGCA
jgi:Polyketide cyclase / dehydrase and lipid transport